MLVNNRCSPRIDRMGDRSPNLRIDRMGDRSPNLVIDRTRVSLKLAGALDNLKANSSLLIEEGNKPTAVIRVLGFLRFPSAYK